MGFYIRKAFSLGPLRLNLSRSGLGASFGVTGARIGIKADGSTYVHVGRGGLYYRQTLTPPPQGQHYGIPAGSLNPTVDNGLQEIASKEAVRLVDSSAGEMLQELDRVKRRVDLFPVIAVVGALLLGRMMLLGIDLPLFAVGFFAISLAALFARHYDVANGTVILNYSLDELSSRSFNELKAAFGKLGACRGFWHVNASGYTTDWKRHAGASELTDRSTAGLQATCPPKVSCNIAVPTLKAKKRSLYFFPDRLLLYDSTGVGAVSYGDLRAETSLTRFIERGFVPGDATQVGTTWRFVNRHGGPDRRFNNNRQLPIMLYGELHIHSPSGLNELFECSVPALGNQAASAINSYGKDPVLPSPSTGITFATPPQESQLVGFVLWAVVVLMAIYLLFPATNSSPSREIEEDQAKSRQIRENQARQAFAQTLAQRLESQHKNLTIDTVNNELCFHLLNEGANSAHRDGLEPFAKRVFFKRFVEPSTESELCSLGFTAVSATRNSKPAFRYPLNCSDPRSQYPKSK